MSRKPSGQSGGAGLACVVSPPQTRDIPGVGVEKVGVDRRFRVSDAFHLGGLWEHARWDTRVPLHFLKGSCPGMLGTFKRMSKHVAVKPRLQRLAQARKPRRQSQTAGQLLRMWGGNVSI